MNIEQIKRHGFQLGLEAELNTQRQGLIDHIKEKKWTLALQCAGNISRLLIELQNVDNPNPPGGMFTNMFTNAQKPISDSN